MQLALILLIISGSISGFVQILNKKLSATKGRSASHAAIISLMNAVLAVPFLFYQFALPSKFETWQLIGVSTLAFAISLWFYFLAYKHADVSTVSIVRRLSIVFVAILAMIFLGEKMSGVGWIGLSLIVLSGMVVTSDKLKIQLSVGVIYGLLSAVFAAASSVLDKKILGDISPFTYVFVNNLLVGFFLIFRKGMLSDAKYLLRHHLRLILLTALLMDIGFGLVLFVLQSFDVSKTLPVHMALSLMIPVVIGITFLKEKKNLVQKWVALGLGLVGIVLLYFGG